MNGQKDFTRWSNQSGHEKHAGIIRGLNVDPRFENLPKQTITDPQQLSSFTKYRTLPDSQLRSRGVSLKAELGIEVGSFDFNKNSFPSNGIGASF